MRNTLNKEQKSSILLLLASKTFERLAFYLIMAILIQYLINSLKLEENKAWIYYSVFYGVMGITTLFSGLIGDLRDRMKVVKIGFILLTLTYLAIAFLPSINFVIITALIILGLGVGIISPNFIVFLGNIYNEKENEIIGLSGFILFSIAISIGALIAPLLSVFLKDNFGYNSIFLVASLFGLLSLILFLKFKSHYNKLNLITEQKINMVNIEIKNLNTIILVSILTISVLIRFVLDQKGYAFTLAARDFIRNGIEINISIYNTAKYISIFVLLVFALIVTRIKTLNWEKIFNMILIGLIFLIIAMVLFASFTSLSELINAKNLFIQSYILLIIAESIISPAILYSIYRSSPIKYKGFLQGIYLFVIVISNSLLFLGLFLHEKSTSMAFIVFAIILLIGVVLIMTLKKTVKHRLIRIERENEIKADEKDYI